VLQHTQVLSFEGCFANATQPTERSSRISGRRLGGLAGRSIDAPAGTPPSGQVAPRPPSEIIGAGAVEMSLPGTVAGVPLREDLVLPQRLQRQAWQSWLEAAALNVSTPRWLPAVLGGRINDGWLSGKVVEDPTALPPISAGTEAACNIVPACDRLLLELVLLPRLPA